MEKEGRDGAEIREEEAGVWIISCTVRSLSSSFRPSSKQQGQAFFFCAICAVQFASNVVNVVQAISNKVGVCVASVLS